MDNEITQKRSVFLNALKDLSACCKEPVTYTDTGKSCFYTNADMQGLFPKLSGIFPPPYASNNAAAPCAMAIDALLPNIGDNPSRFAEIAALFSPHALHMQGLKNASTKFRNRDASGEESVSKQAWSKACSELYDKLDAVKDAYEGLPEQDKLAARNYGKNYLWSSDNGGWYITRLGTGECFVNSSSEYHGTPWNGNAAVICDLASVKDLLSHNNVNQWAHLFFLDDLYQECNGALNIEVRDAQGDAIATFCARYPLKERNIFPYGGNQGTPEYDASDEDWCTACKSLQNKFPAAQIEFPQAAPQTGWSKK